MKYLFFTAIAIVMLTCAATQDKFVQQHGRTVTAQVMAENEANGRYRGFPGVR